QLVEGFLAATQRGDIQALMSMLAQDATFTADGGGKVPAVRRPVQGRDAVAKVLIGLARNVERALHTAFTNLRFESAEVNAETALLLWVDERLDTVFVYSVVDDQVAAIRALRNPEKLAYIQRQLRAQGDVPGAPPISAA